MKLSKSAMDRAQGAFLGLAIGDALGTTLEFTRRDQQAPLTDMIGGGPFSLPAGYWTDDTSMALCLAESLVAKRKFSPFDIMEKFVAWRDKGENSSTGTCFDIGNITWRALQDFVNTGNFFAGSERDSASGNGSIMRLAPAVLFFLFDKAACCDYAIKQSRLTHASPECLEANSLMAEILFQFIQGSHDINISGHYGQPKIIELINGSYIGKTRDKIKSSGYVIDTLEAALWAVEKSGSFKEAILLAVNLGDDADTVGAVTGQIAGAKWGASAIPEEWLDKLLWAEKIRNFAANLVETGFETHFRKKVSGPQFSPSP